MIIAPKRWAVILFFGPLFGCKHPWCIPGVSPGGKIAKSRQKEVPRPILLRCLINCFINFDGLPDVFWSLFGVLLFDKAEEHWRWKKHFGSYAHSRPSSYSPTSMRRLGPWLWSSVLSFALTVKTHPFKASTLTTHYTTNRNGHGGGDGPQGNWIIMYMAVSR